jgi:hypothetical protein
MFGWLRLRRHAIGESDLSGYLDGELPPARSRRVEEHLRDCPACRSHLEELRALKQTLGSLPEAAPPRSFVLTPEQARQPVRLRPAYAAVRIYPALRNAAAAAAVLFFALVGADVFISDTDGRAPSEGGAVMVQSGSEDLEEGVAADRGAAGESSDEQKELAPAPAETAPPAIPPPATGPSEEGPAAEPTAEGEAPAPAAEATAPPATLLGAEPTVEEPILEREAAPEESDMVEEEDGPDWLRVFEGVAGGAAIALVVTAFILRRRRPA